MLPQPTKNAARRSNKNDPLNVADRAVVIVAVIAGLVAMDLQVDLDRLVEQIPVHNALAVQPVVALDNPLDLHTVAVGMAADTVAVDMVEAKADDLADQNAVVEADETVMRREVAEADVVVMKVVDQLSRSLSRARSQ